MAVTDASAGALAFAGNGANRPLHQDRQILRAGDLALEQATQDAMLARARRYLHGWGVVSGFVPEVNDGVLLTVGPGYGVTPLGDELFLPEPVSLPKAAKVTVLSCGPGPVGCDIVDPEALEVARAATRDLTVTSFLIARPASREAALRPGVPEGCAHPASILLPSRRCGGVEFAILCALPPSHVPETLNCKTLTQFVCGPRGGAPLPLPWETLPGPEANFLVVAKLTVTDGTLTATVGNRRTLWPVALIQDWISACLCPTMGRETPPNGDDIDSPGGGGIRPGGDFDRPVGGGTRPGVGPGGLVEAPSGAVDLVLGGIAPLARAADPSGNPVALTPDETRRLRDELHGNVTDIPGIGSVRAKALAGIGVTTEGEFLTTPLEQLAAALRSSVVHPPEAVVTDMKKELSARHDLGLAF